MQDIEERKRLADVKKKERPEEEYTVIPRFWRPRFWRPLQIGDFIYLVSSWAHLLHTYNLDFGDFDFGDLNFDRSKKSPK